VAQMLCVMGFEVRQAKSADAAVASIARSGVVDVLVVELNIPEMSGLELHQMLEVDAALRLTKRV
jgi:CheY-like chemotaxis protein